MASLWRFECRPVIVAYVPNKAYWQGTDLNSAGVQRVRSSGGQPMVPRMVGWSKAEHSVAGEARLWIFFSGTCSSRSAVPGRAMWCFPSFAGLAVSSGGRASVAQSTSERPQCRDVASPSGDRWTETLDALLHLAVATERRRPSRPQCTRTLGRALFLYPRRLLWRASNRFLPCFTRDADGLHNLIS